MKLRETVEIVPVHIARLAPAAQVAFGHPANLAAKRHQQRPIIVDAVILIVPAEFRVEDRRHFANRRRKLMVKPKTHLG